MSKINKILNEIEVSPPNTGSLPKQKITPSVLIALVKTMINNQGYKDKIYNKLSFYKSGLMIPTVLTTNQIFFMTSSGKPYLIEFLNQFVTENEFTYVTIEDVTIVE